MSTFPFPDGWIGQLTPLLGNRLPDFLHALEQPPCRGVRTRLLETAFACLLAVVVMLSIRWVGTLMLNAMLVLPAASARNLARNVRRYHLLSVLLALACSIVGLLLSFAWGTASGATIVLILAAGYAITLGVRSRSAG